MRTFRDWLQARESSAFTRLRHDAAFGLKPPIPGAMIHSRSTAHPFEVEKLTKKKKRKNKKKKRKLCVEGKKDGPSPDSKVDNFLNAVGVLKHELDDLEDKLEKDKDKDKEDQNKISKKPVEDINDKADKDVEEEEKEEKEEKDKDNNFKNFVAKKDKKKEESDL